MGCELRERRYARDVRTERIAFAFVIASALGCSDGVGHPIVGNEPSASGAGAPGGGVGGSGGVGGRGNGGIAAGDMNGGRDGLPGLGGRFPGSGGWDGRREPPPRGSCEGLAEWPDEAAAAEFAVLDFLNFGRSSGFACNGSSSTTAPPIVMKPELQCAARLHSRDMAMRNFFDHTNPDGETPEDRIRKTGYPFGAVGESIARASGAPEAVPYEVLESLAAEGGMECEILLDPRFDSVGIGQFSDLWTLDFAGP